MLAGVLAATGLAACGGGARQDANEPSGTFPVQVTAATFPAQQRLAQHTHLVITVRNAGRVTIPDIAVTISDPRYRTSVQAFGQYLSTPELASHSRPVWIVDHAPQPPPSPATGNSSCGYSCQGGGPGGAVTAYANTWALGALKPGQAITFDWAVTAISPGVHEVEYVVAAGLNGKAKARLAGGGLPRGTFTVRIANRPAQAYVDNSGKVVITP